MLIVIILKSGYVLGGIVSYTSMTKEELCPPSLFCEILGTSFGPDTALIHRTNQGI